MASSNGFPEHGSTLLLPRNIDIVTIHRSDVVRVYLEWFPSQPRKTISDYLTATVKFKNYNSRCGVLVITCIRFCVYGGFEGV